ncbi:MAG: tripartite tricarboxylate transporter substrate binding protein [Burkholderiaceae bacterium]
MFKKISSLLASALASAVFVVPAIAAQDYPNRPLRIIAPSSPGGILDLSSRLIAKYLSAKLGQPVLVENMAGAGGIIGMQGLLRAEPDGYTLVMGSLGPNAANYSLYPTLPYALNDFAPVINVISMPSILVVHPSVPAKNLDELATYSRTRSGGASMAISTMGASSHLIGEQVKATLKMPATNIVYKGASPALTDLAGGQVDFMVDNMVSAQPLVQAGRIRALAVFTPVRNPALPDVPTVVELGHPELVGGTWIGLLARAGTPAPIVEKLNKALNDVLTDPEVKDTFQKQGGTPIGGSPAQFDTFIRDEQQRWAKVIRQANIKVE